MSAVEKPAAQGEADAPSAWMVARDTDIDPPEFFTTEAEARANARLGVNDTHVTPLYRRAPIVEKPPSGTHDEDCAINVNARHGCTCERVVDARVTELIEVERSQALGIANDRATQADYDKCEEAVARTVAALHEYIASIRQPVAPDSEAVALMRELADAVGALTDGYHNPDLVLIRRARAWIAEQEAGQ